MLRWPGDSQLPRCGNEALVANWNFSATRLEDLWLVPGNRLESLKGDRDGQFSIRINDQYRICFIWKDSDVFEVEITDYH
jgi:proteic killer suppression protein